ncbi:hypothetical protein Ahy_A03g012049 [Arachis hypogaea]|uniref:Aminotransferase-like plant mobile domain-containing protein n=1 Tax=Arachis hypogaea TaxID=3818 RepID=A0A445DSJ6_ARAHY|nr:hypothetical protein Ahy_A03g012049 [Arachis hypogaea]
MLGSEFTGYFTSEPESTRVLKEAQPTKDRLLQYIRKHIMQIIGGILFPDASDSCVHMRWLPQLENLDRYGRLSWGSGVLAWLYR